MARNRVIYQSKAVYAGPDKGSSYGNESGTTQPTQLKRVQSANYGFDIARTDVNQFGELARIDSIVLETPTVNFDTSWYLCNFYNEDMIGLKVDASQGILADVLSSNAGERNYYIRVVDEGSDAKGYDASAEGTAQSDVIGIGNGFLTNWSCEASVGGFPTASVTVEGMNIAFTKGTGGFCPHVSGSNGAKNDSLKFNLPEVTQSGASTSTVKVVKQGDISFTLPSNQGGVDMTKMHIQSFNAAVDMSREPLQKLGSRFAYTREINFPINATMSVDALVGDMETGNLADIVDRNLDQTCIVTMDPDQSSDKMQIILKGAKLDSQSISQGIGDNQTVTYSWSAQVGDKNDSSNGLFLSGAAS